MLTGLTDLKMMLFGHSGTDWRLGRSYLLWSMISLYSIYKSTTGVDFIYFLTISFMRKIISNLTSGIVAKTKWNFSPSIYVYLRAKIGSWDVFITITSKARFINWFWREKDIRSQSWRDWNFRCTITCTRELDNLNVIKLCIRCYFSNFSNWRIWGIWSFSSYVVRGTIHITPVITSSWIVCGRQSFKKHHDSLFHVRGDE